MSNTDRIRRGNAWGEDPGDERKTWLAEQLDAWEVATDHGALQGPFDGQKLNGSDISWLFAHGSAGTDSPDAVVEIQSKIASTLGNLEMPVELYDSAPALPLRGALLVGAQLKMAVLIGADLRDANLTDAFLPGAELEGARLERANLVRAQLQIATMRGAQLQEADLMDAELNRADLEGAMLQQARLQRAILEKAELGGANLERANLNECRLNGANLQDARLAGAFLRDAHLEAAQLDRAHLAGRHVADDDEELRKLRATLPRFPARLHAADLRRAHLDRTTSLKDAIFAESDGEAPYVVDTHWGDVDLSRLRWGPKVRRLRLRDENYARELWRSYLKQRGKESDLRRRAYEQLREAARANQQFAAVLRTQDLHRYADQFTFRMHDVRRQQYRQVGDRWSFFWWTVLKYMAGFGYRLEWTLAWYAAVLVVSTLVYGVQGLAIAHPSYVMVCAAHTCGPQRLPAPSWYEVWGQAFIASVTALHGRGIFSGQAQTAVQQGMAAFDAVAGLVIEASFVATFTQKIFGR